MPKFKIGDKVKCLARQPKMTYEKMGAGFESGKEFVVSNITQERSSDPIYWPDKESCGVYEHELEELEWDG